MLTLVAWVAIAEVSGPHSPATWALALDIAVGVAGAITLPWLVERPVAAAPIEWWFLIVVASYAAIVGWGAWRQARCALLAAIDERARE